MRTLVILLLSLIVMLTSSQTSIKGLPVQVQVKLHHLGLPLGRPVKLSNFSLKVLIVMLTSSQTSQRSTCPSPSQTTSPWPTTGPSCPALNLLLKGLLIQVQVNPSQPGQTLVLPVLLHPLLPSPCQLPPCWRVMMASSQTSLNGSSVDLISKGF